MNAFCSQTIQDTKKRPYCLLSKGEEKVLVDWDAVGTRIITVAFRTTEKVNINVQCVSAINK